MEGRDERVLLAIGNQVQNAFALAEGVKVRIKKEMLYQGAEVLEIVRELFEMVRELHEAGVVCVQIDP